MGPRIEWVSSQDVESFVLAWTADQPNLRDARIMLAEKIFDSVEEDRFIYMVDLDNGTSLIFDSYENFVHSESSDEFAYVEEEFLALDALPAEVSEALQSANPDFSITEVVKEFAFETDPASDEERSFVYKAVIEKDGEKLEVGLDRNGSIVLTIGYEESEFEENQWKAVKLPQNASDYLASNYKDGAFPIGYFVDERPSLTENGNELVAFLDNDIEVIFDELGNFVREMDPWKAFEENLDAGLKFDAARSSWGDDSSDFDEVSSFVHIQKVESNDVENEDDEEEFSTMPLPGLQYRISLLNQDIDDKSTPGLGQLDLSTVGMSSGTKLNLTFTYEMSPPRYLIVSGANVTAFKHRLSDWDRPGSFTIQAETVSPRCVCFQHRSLHFLDFWNYGRNGR